MAVQDHSYKTKIIDFIKSSDGDVIDEVKLCLDNLALEISKDSSTRDIIANTILSEVANSSIESSECLEMLKYVLMYLDIRLDEIEGNPDVIRKCIYTNNMPLVKFLVNDGYKFNGNGNIVRQAVYSNRLDIAELLIHSGYAVPEKITLFSISNQLSWDSNRLKFLLDMGSKLSIENKEADCIYTIYDALKQKESVV